MQCFPMAGLRKTTTKSAAFLGRGSEGGSVGGILDTGGRFTAATRVEQHPADVAASREHSKGERAFSIHTINFFAALLSFTSVILSKSNFSSCANVSLLHFELRGRLAPAL